MTTTPEATKGVPRHAGDSSYTPRDDHNALADWVRDNVDASVATTADLPATGNWAGRKMMVQADKSLHMFDGTGWVRIVADTGWVNLTLINGWTNVTGTAQYRRINGVVYLRGRLTGGSTGVCANLPAGCRPSVDAHWIARRDVVLVNATTLTVRSNGDVELRIGTDDDGGVWLNAAVFPADV